MAAPAHIIYYGFDLGFLMTSAFFSELDSRNLTLRFFLEFGLNYMFFILTLTLIISKSNHITIPK